MKKILLLGKNGQVGWELQHTLLPLGEVTALDRQQADLTQSDTLRSIVRTLKPNIIVNAAAYTAVDLAEKERDLAMQVNGITPGILAEEALSLKATLVHYSTDYVFDGTASQPYTEQDQPNPINFYGHSKLAGEKAIQSVGGNYAIFRTSWVFGMRGTNFLLKMLQLAKDRKELRIVNDQWGAPTWSHHIAQMTTQVLLKESLPSGIYHLTSSGWTHWCDFAAAIFTLHSQTNPSFISPKLQGIPSSAYPSPAKRPLYSLLSNHQLTQTFGIKLPSWEIGLKQCFNK